MIPFLELQSQFEQIEEEVRAAIDDVLRHRMYFEDYGVEKLAMNLYADLEVNASACQGCDAPCLGSCPLGISIQERTTGAHDLLQFG